jgi:hypothetical protein
MQRGTSTANLLGTIKGLSVFATAIGYKSLTIS